MNLSDGRMKHVSLLMKVLGSFHTAKIILP